MKGIVMGVVGLGGVGAAAYVGTGTGGPDDFIAHVNKSPQAVYAAFSALGPEGEIALPGEKGWGSRVRQRITKTANEEVKLVVEVDGKELISAEVEMTPEGDGTRIAAEFDFDEQAMNALIREAGAEGLPSMAFEEWMMDQAFAEVMKGAVSRIEEGKPLLSLYETRARWGRDSSTPASGRTSGTRVSETWEQRQRTRPQLDARPALNPNEATREHSRGRNTGAY